MRPSSPDEEVGDTPPIALQLAPASNPGSDSPRGTTGLEPRVSRDSQRPAFLMPTAESDDREGHREKLLAQISPFEA
ncbi:hypothetical protein N0V93_001841 [Gnomoniopsis smithogilvyi]|uniref:Uncharacterized protein n=1 Tax=Gnomoniopsis smithogilvyi TaxID=1191159 RepID=A0A9W9D220_9PEZI|nr:hypothetical protein N0V93_001841 [Gnomoniopsis smithogilvyi]